VADGREGFPTSGRDQPETGEERRTDGNGWPNVRQI